MVATNFSPLGMVQVRGPGTGMATVDIEVLPGERVLTRISPMDDIMDVWRCVAVRSRREEDGNVQYEFK